MPNRENSIVLYLNKLLSRSTVKTQTFNHSIMWVNVVLSLFGMVTGVYLYLTRNYDWFKNHELHRDKKMVCYRTRGGHNILQINDLNLVKKVFIEDANCFVNNKRKAREDKCKREVMLVAKLDASKKEVMHISSTEFTSEKLQRMSRNPIHEKMFLTIFLIHNMTMSKIAN